MDKHVIQGKAKKLYGKAKQKTGEALNDRELQAKGAAKRVEGEVEERIGKARDAFDTRH